jgi:hypothetical protein
MAEAALTAAGMRVEEGAVPIPGVENERAPVLFVKHFSKAKYKAMVGRDAESDSDQGV